MNLPTSLLASDAATVMKAWHAQYGSTEDQALAHGLVDKLSTQDLDLRRQALIVEAFWTFRRGEPSDTLVGDVERLHDACMDAHDLRFAAIARIALAQWHGRNQRYPAACEAARSALALCQQEGASATRFDITIVLNGLGVYCSHLQQWHEALECFFQALQGIAELGDPGLESALLSNLGTVFFSTGNLDDALDAFDRANAVAQKSGNVRQQRNIVLNRSHTLCLL
jgi:tetratricopeptide (TPR) repeat protein